MAIEINTSAGNTIEVTQSDGTSVTFNQETSSVSVSSPASTSVQVLEKGVKGDKGDTGPQGEVGPGVASGGSENQFLQKNSATDYDTKWSAYTLPSADGDDGQVLTTNGAATVTFAYPKTIAEDVKNVSGGPLTKGTPVHVTGSVGNLAEVIAADAATNYPAHFVLDEDLVDDAEGKGIALGFINNVDVPDASIYTEGQTVYLGASGGWTTTKPTGANAIQNLGIIIKVNTSGNKISGIIMGAGRANDVPNIATGNIWAGNADGVATATSVAYIDIANSRVGIGTTSPSYPLDVDGGTENNVASFASTDAVAQLRVIDYSLVPFYFGVNGTNAYISPTGGTPAGGLAVTSTGRVGIGTASPTSKLEVNGGVTASGPIDSSDATNTSITSETARFNKFGLMTNRSSLYITNYNASGSMQFGIGGVHAASTKMYLSSDGELGIGTTSPSYALDIKKDTTSILNLYRPNSSTAAASVLDFSFNTANATESVYARIRADVETNTDLAQGGDLSFHTANSGTVSEKLRITQEGNVGIGTTSPVTPLHVYSNDGFTGTPGGLTIEQNGTGDAILQFLLTSAKRWVVGIDNNNNDNFKISGTADLGTDNGLTITNSTYNVGIGTTSPSAKLDVVGLANINDGSSNVMISSNNTSLTTGTENTAVGENAASGISTGTKNTAVGRSALGTSSAATNGSNTAIGHSALYQATGGSNTAIGRNAGLKAGASNVAVGAFSLNNTTGDTNVAVGTNALSGDATSTFSGCVAVGYNALNALTTGSSNTAVGYNALESATSASYNSAFGSNALESNLIGSSNSAFGVESLRYNTGANNTAFGTASLRSKTSGDNNSAFGVNALYNNLTGSNNIAIGRNAGYYTTGSNNALMGYYAGYGAAASTFSNTVAVGYQALYDLTSGAGNTAVGYQASTNINSGNNNTTVGYQAGYAITSGSSNSFFGTYAGVNSTGSNNTAIGHSANFYNTTGSANVVIGREAAFGASGASTFSSTVAVGYQALHDLTTGAQNTAIGYQAASAVSTANNNTAIGHEALEGSNTSYNTAVGAYSLQYNTAGERNTAVGWYALAESTGSYNVSLGMRAGEDAGSGNTSLGYDAGRNTTGDNNVIIGREAGLGVASTSTYSNTVAVGYQALTALTTGISNTAVGYQAAFNNSTGQYNTAGGHFSMRNATSSVQFNTALGSSSARNVTGNANTAVGHEASFNGGAGNTSIGWRAGYNAANYNVSVGYGAASNTTGTGNVVVGYNAAVGGATSNFSSTVAVGREALNSLTTGAENNAIGYQAGTNINTGNYNTAIGHQAGQQITTANHNSLFGRHAGQDVTGANNVGIGSLALADCVSSNNNVAIGYGAARGTSGSAAPNNTVAIGYESLRNVTTANTNVVIGRSSGYSITTGGNNVLLGHESGYSLVGGASNVMLGYQAGYNETGSNKLYIANSNTTTPLIYGDFSLGEITINGDLNVSGGNLKADAIEISGRAMTTPATGEYGSGSKLVTQFATGTVTAGKVYVANAGAWAEGDADAGSTSIGMIAVATDAASAAEMLIEGTVKLSSNTGFSGASAGDVLYLSTTAGELTTTAPSAAGDYVRVCGYVVSASTNEVFFSPSRDWTAL